MNYNIHPISGNSHTIKLIPVTVAERDLLNRNNDEEAITAFYHHAVDFKFNRHLKLASITRNIDYPYSATVELFAEYDSVEGPRHYK